MARIKEVVEKPEPAKKRGRPAGSVNKRTKALQEKAVRMGITPLEFMLRNMRKSIPKNATVAERIAMEAQKLQAARDAAPYVHARLSAVAVSGGLKLNHESALDELE